MVLLEIYQAVVEVEDNFEAPPLSIRNAKNLKL
jgi:hypothetical protein